MRVCSSRRVQISITAERIPRVGHAEALSPLMDAQQCQTWSVSRAYNIHLNFCQLLLLLSIHILLTERKNIWHTAVAI